MTDESKKSDVSLDDVLAKVAALETKTAALEQENTRLNAFAQRTIAEKKEEKEKADQKIADLAKEKEDAKTHTKEEANQLIQQYKDRLEAAEKQIADAAAKEYQNKVRDEALKLATTKAEKDPVRRELLAEKLEKRIKINEDGSITVLNERGEATISTVDVLVNEVSNKYKCLVDGLDSTGGGSHSSGGAQVKKLSEMSESEKVDLLRTDRAKYQELKSLETP